jgi:hypothetical protein
VIFVKVQAASGKWYFTVAGSFTRGTYCIKCRKPHTDKANPFVNTPKGWAHQGCA